MTRQLPAAKTVRDLLEEVLGRVVNVSPGEPFRATDVAAKALLVSVIVDDSLKMRAVIGMDLQLAAYAGAAIGLIPLSGAKACVEEYQLTPMIAENVTEVCNIMSTLLNKDETESTVRMYKTYLPGKKQQPPPPADAVGYLLAIGRRLDLNVEVISYGTGRFSIMLTG